MPNCMVILLSCSPLAPNSLSLWIDNYRVISTFVTLNKVYLQTSLERNSSNFSYFSFLGVNFENLTVKFHVPYVLNMHIKFCSNWMSFTIWSINLFFIHNFRSQKLEILTFVWWNSNWSLIFLKFCKHEWYNKNMQSNDYIFEFTLNIKIYDEFENFFSKLV